MDEQETKQSKFLNVIYGVRGPLTPKHWRTKLIAIHIDDNNAQFKLLKVP